MTENNSPVEQTEPRKHRGAMIGSVITAAGTLFGVVITSLTTYFSNEQQIREARITACVSHMVKREDTLMKYSGELVKLYGTLQTQDDMNIEQNPQKLGKYVRKFTEAAMATALVSDLPLQAASLEVQSRLEYYFIAVNKRDTEKNIKDKKDGFANAAAVWLKEYNFQIAKFESGESECRSRL